MESDIQTVANNGTKECHDDRKSEVDPEDVSRDSAGEKEKDVGSRDEEDVVLKLHSAQEALQREVQNLKGVPLFLDEEEASNPEAELEFNNMLEIVEELEEIFKQRIQVEVQYIAISKAIDLDLDQLKLMIAQQRKLASQQVETMNKVENAETKAVQLKRQAERLDKTCQEILYREEAFKLKSRMCRLSTCFSIQLMLLLLAVYLFVLQFCSELLLVPT